MRIELPFERKAAYPSGFSCGRNINFVKKSSFQLKGRNTISLGRKPFMLEPEGSRTLFPYEN
jgi:hypothetical protein